MNEIDLLPKGLRGEILELAFSRDYGNRTDTLTAALNSKPEDYKFNAKMIKSLTGSEPRIEQAVSTDGVVWIMKFEVMRPIPEDEHQAWLSDVINRGDRNSRRYWRSWARDAGLLSEEDFIKVAIEDMKSGRD